MIITIMINISAHYGGKKQVEFKNFKQYEHNFITVTQEIVIHY